MTPSRSSAAPVGMSENLGILPGGFFASLLAKDRAEREPHTGPPPVLVVERTIALSPWCQRQHDLNDVTDRELIQGNLRCGCWIDGDKAARVLRARRLVEARTR